MSPAINSGPLAGLTILRFAHAYDSGGGTERYLDDLDRARLERNAMTVIRLHLSRSAAVNSPIEQDVGRGRLIRIPLPVVKDAARNMPSSEHSLGVRLKQMARDWVLYNPIIWRVWGARWAASRPLPPEAGQAIGAGPAAAAVMRARRVDLVMLHFFGGADADEVAVESRKAGVPLAVLNHYSNDRFLHFAIRKHVMLANAVAGVNGLGLPRYLRDGFANLSDGIDTDFFRHDLARPLADSPASGRRLQPSEPLILLPARVVREKGQMDLVRAAASLRASGLKCRLAFAGRVDSTAFVDELRQEIARVGMTESVLFPGNLTVEALRDWYAASSVVAFPTYHHEGLGRVIVEAQAMGVPVVAYATGGVPEGIISGQTGFLVATGDVAGLAARLRELLLAPNLRESMGARGRAEAEKQFSLAALASRHEQFYLATVASFRT